MSLQKKISLKPSPQELLVELIHKEKNHHLFFYPLESRSIHQTLCTLVTFRWLSLHKTSFTISSNDFGCEIISPEPFENVENIFKTLFSLERLEEDLEGAFNLSQMAKSAFRDIARIAGLVIQGYPTKRKTLRQIQMTSSLLYDVFENYDPHNLLLEQARKEVQVKEIELDRLKKTLERIQGKEFRFVYLKRFSPFSLPLYLESESEHLSNETLEEKMKKAVKGWLT